MLSISNANPIQFWLAGELSFNEKEVCSIYPVCFCQTFRFDDVIRMQLKDTNSSKTYALRIYKQKGGIVSNTTFTFSKTIISDGAQYDLNIIPNSLPMDEEQYEFKIVDENNSEVAYSDCINITNSDECTELIQYSNSSNFAGLDFTSDSPATYFYLRIPAIFFEEQFPQEQEDLELSDDTIVTLWSKIEGKKMLDIGYMPFYMHKKLQFVLMMDNVLIDAVPYRMRDPYQITPASSKRSALRRASVVLSQKDFIDRNLL